MDGIKGIFDSKKGSMTSAALTAISALALAPVALPAQLAAIAAIAIVTVAYNVAQAHVDAKSQAKSEGDEKSS